MTKRAPRKSYTLRLPAEMMAKLEAEASAQHISINSVIIHAIMARQAEAGAQAKAA
jgi:predicted HicB family RNase H-like nuclease